MIVRLTHTRGDSRSFVLVLSSGDEAVEGLSSFAEKYRVRGASFTAIGAFREATIAYFDWETKQYEEMQVPEQVEVLSLVGNLAESERRPKVHAHVTLSYRDGSALGGHLVRGVVRPTLEVFLIESEIELRRSIDAQTGLTLIDLEGE